MSLLYRLTYFAFISVSFWLIKPDPVMAIMPVEEAAYMFSETNELPELINQVRTTGLARGYTVDQVAEILYKDTCLSEETITKIAKGYPNKGNLSEDFLKNLFNNPRYLNFNRKGTMDEVVMLAQIYKEPERLPKLIFYLKEMNHASDPMTHNILARVLYHRSNLPKNAIETIVQQVTPTHNDYGLSAIRNGLFREKRIARWLPSRAKKIVAAGALIGAAAIVGLPGAGETANSRVPDAGKSELPSFAE